LNKLPPNAIIITDIVGDTVKIMVCGQDLINRMRLIGFSCSDESMIIHVNNEQKNIIISQLINEGALFLHGNGWYPSEVMECNKDQKNYFGKYKIIYWIDKNTYQIEER
jgi:hypothetical protein